MSYQAHLYIRWRNRIGTGLCSVSYFMLFSVLPLAAAQQNSLAMQASAAESVGTSTNLNAASQKLWQQFDKVAGVKRGHITLEDLRSMSQSQDFDSREAAKFFIVSPIDRELAGNRSGLTKARLRRCAEATKQAALYHALLQQHDPAHDPTRKNVASFYALFLRDPGVSEEIRSTVVRGLTDDQILQIIGHPNTLGSARDVSDETAAFLYLAKLSWLGAAEDEAIAFYQVPFTMLRGAQDHSASFWEGHAVHLSEKMLTGGTGQVNDATLASHIGIFAHESGHAIFSLSGLSKALNEEMAHQNFTHGLDSIINEAVAGIFQNRSHVAVQGYGHNKDSDANLVLAHDVAKNIVNDQTFYAKYYHVNTAVARAQFPQVKQVLANVVVPYFETRFGLLGDPQLTSTLPHPTAKPQ